MMTLMIGGSGSGKSAYAEDYITRLSDGKKKYYIATMQAFDDESLKRITRHRTLREGKDFFTIEQPLLIQKAAEYMENGEKTALLECISNLTANEMFAGTVPKTEDMTVKEVIRGIAILKEKLAHFVVVSNNVFEDGRCYDEAAMAYIRAMGRINEMLADMADVVVEVAAGIPVVLKEGQKGMGISCIL